MALLPIFNAVLMIGAVVLLIFALFSQTFQKFRVRATSQQRFDLEPPQYFRRYRAGRELLDH
jgi:hypothetical protein